jgi:hypothetical protein
VSVVAAAGGQVEVTGPGCATTTCSVPSNAQVTLEATPESNHRFTGWQGGGACDGFTTNPLQVTVTESLTCTAQFIERVVVSGAVAGVPEGTSVSATAPNVTFADCTGASCEVDSDASVVLTAPPVIGYYVTGWSGDGCPTTGSQINVLASQTLTCTANYAPGLAVLGVVTGRAGGVAAASESAGATCSANQCAVTPGSSVSLSRPADDPRGRWLGWFGSEGCSGTSDTLVLQNVTAATSCEARFASRLLATASSNVAGETMGVSSNDPNDVCQDGGCYVEAGSDVSFEAPLLDGYVFDGWSGDCDDPSSATALLGVAADVNCYAAYQRLLVVTAVPSNVQATISGSSDSDNCTGASCTVLAGEPVTFRVSSYWQITGTTGTDCSLGSDDGVAVVVLENPQYNGQSCAIEVAPRTDVTLNASGDGSVTFSDDGGLDCFGEGSFVRCLGPATAPVTIQASPNAGAGFTGWSGATCPVDGSTDATETLTPAGGDFDCIATFAPLITVTATVSSGGHAVFLEPPQCELAVSACTAPAGSTFSIDFVFDDTYHFYDWSPDDSRCDDMYASGYVANESFECHALTVYDE